MSDEVMISESQMIELLKNESEPVLGDNVISTNKILKLISDLSNENDHEND